MKNKIILILIVALFLFTTCGDNPWFPLSYDEDEKPENPGGNGDGNGGDDTPPVLFTIILDNEGLTDASDSVSINKSEAYEGETVTVSYTLNDTHDNNRLVLTFGHETDQVTISAAGTSTHTYTVNHGDAVNDVITITAATIHTNLIILDPVTNVSFDKDGVISFTAGANCAAANSTYTYTLYNNSTAVTGFIDVPVTNGTTPSGIVNKMLENAGGYTVTVKANTANTFVYLSPSVASSASSVVLVYDVNVTITGAAGADKVTYNGADYTSNFKVSVFVNSSPTFTAVPSGNRWAAWNGIYTAGSNDHTLTNIISTENISVAFADPSIAITTQPAISTSFTTGSISGNLSVAATVNPSDRVLSYQWYSNTTNSNTGGTSVGNTGNAATFTIPTTLAAGTYYYFCEITTPGATTVRSNVAAVQVTDIIPLNDSDFSVTQTYTYTGQTITPTFTSALPDSGYNISYTNGTSNRTNIGTFTMTFNGIENYSGTVSRTIEITAAPLTMNITTTGATAYTGGAFDINGSNSFTVTLSGFPANASATAVTLNIGSTSTSNFSGHTSTTNHTSGTKTFTVNITSMSAATSNLTLSLDGTGAGNHTLAPASVTATTIYYGTGTSALPFPVTQRNVGGPTSGFNQYAATADGRNKHYKQIENITLTGTNNWTAIGQGAASFSGIYNGNGNSITGLSNSTGMFYSITGSGSGTTTTTGIIENVILNDIAILGNTVIGGIVGTNYGGKVENCSVIGNSTIIGGNTVGGIAGECTGGGIIRNCYNISTATPAVRGYDRVGGIVGYAISSQIENCFNASNVTSDGTNTGGILGHGYETTVPIKNCYNNGNIDGNNNVGGVVGGTGSYIEFCYSTGTVSGANNVGGIIGSSSGGVFSCVALNTSISGMTNRGRVAGSASDNMFRNYANSNMSGPFTGPYNQDTKDGANVAAGTGTNQFNNQTWWQNTVDWYFAADSAWEWDTATNLPKLRGVGQ